MKHFHTLSRTAARPAPADFLEKAAGLSNLMDGIRTAQELQDLLRKTDEHG
jgi:hypothetical protein